MKIYNLASSEHNIYRQQQYEEKHYFISQMTKCQISIRIFYVECCRTEEYIVLISEQEFITVKMYTVSEQVI